MRAWLSVCAAALTLSAGVGVWPGTRPDSSPAPQANANRRPTPTPKDAKPSPAGPFLLAVEDVFYIPGRGTVVTGRVERGKVRVGDAVELVGLRAPKQTTVAGIEAFRKLLEEAAAGDNVGLVLRGVERGEVERGQVVAKPGSVSAHGKFKARIHMYASHERGRNTPIFKGYRPQFYFRTRDVSGVVSLPAGREMVMPGEKDVEVEVSLISPVALEKGQPFAIREGGRTVGEGAVTAVLD